MQLTPEEILQHSEELVSEQQVHAALVEMAQVITQTLGDTNPLVMCVMKGAVVFAGQLLPMLNFPLEFDYLHATRYRDQTSGGEIEWRVFPQDRLHGRTVLILDDILDEGHTLAAIRDRCLEFGAKGFYSAVLVEKLLDHPKPIAADFVGITLPNRYVFGCGMDVNGQWRNLPSIFAMR